MLDPRLGGTLTQVLPFAVLKDHGVDRLYYLEAGAYTRSRVSST